LINIIFVLLHYAGQAASTETTVHPANYGKNHGIPVAAPSKGHHHSMPVINTHGKTHGPPVVVPAKRKHHHAPANGEGMLPVPDSLHTCHYEPSTDNKATHEVMSRRTWYFSLKVSHRS
jgi:hypothetical protein